MDNLLEIYKCPLCLDTLTHYSPRYPKAICSNCASKTIKDNDGNVVSFHNIDIYGGFISRHTINNAYNNVIVEKLINIFFEEKFLIIKKFLYINLIVFI